MRFHNAALIAAGLFWFATISGIGRVQAAEPQNSAARFAASTTLQSLLSKVTNDAISRMSPDGIRPFGAEEEARLLYAIRKLEEYSANPETRPEAVTQIIAYDRFFEEASMVNSPVERAITALYLKVLETGSRGTASDQELSVSAVKHVAATGNREQFNRILIFAVRLTVESVSLYNWQTEVPDPSDAEAAANALTIIARVAWTCHWDREGEIAALAATQLVYGTKLQVPVAARFAQARLETGVPSTGPVINALTSTLTRRLPRELSETVGIKLPTLETTLRLVASLAVQRGYRTEAGRLWAVLRTIRWRTPVGAPATTAALRLAHEASLAACGIGTMPHVGGFSISASHDPGDKLISTMARAAAYRSEAIGRLRERDIKGALVPLNHAVALAWTIGWRDIPSGDPRKSSNVSVQYRPLQLDNLLVGLGPLLRLRFYVAVLAKNGAAVTFGLDWLQALSSSDRNNAVYEAVWLLGNVGGLDDADRFIETALPILDGSPFPSMPELDGHFTVKDRLSRHPDLALLRADLLLRQGRVTDAVDSLSYVTTSGNQHEATTSLSQRRTVSAVAAQLHGQWRESGPANSPPPEISLAIPPRLRNIPDYNGIYSGTDDSASLLEQIYQRLNGSDSGPKARDHAAELFFRVIQESLISRLDVSMRLNIARRPDTPRAAAITLFHQRTMAATIDLMSAMLAHDIKAREARYSPILDAYDFADSLRLLDPPCPAVKVERRIPGSTVLSGFALWRRWDAYQNLRLQSAHEGLSSAGISPADHFEGSGTYGSDHIARLLKPGEVVILAARAGANLAVTTVSPAGLAIHLSPSYEAILKNISEVHASLTVNADGVLPPFAHQAARRLSTALLAGLPDASLDQAQHLYLVLDDGLQALPENVLLSADWDTSKRLADQPWIDTTLTIQRLFGLNALEFRYWRPLAPQPPPRPQMTIAVGAPTLSGAADCGPAAWLAQKPPSAEEVAMRVASLCSLPRAADMLVRLTRLEGMTANRLTGSSATLRQFRALVGSGDVERATTLIFATHGLNAADAERVSGVAEPALVLTPSVADRDPGLLRASEIGAIQLQADLIVLIACNSGVRSSADATSYRGLVDAFLTAGASSLMMAGWPVDETATSLLFEFYSRERGEGHAEPRDALARAIRRLRGSGTPYGHPYYWAPFSYTGTADSL